MMSEKVGFVKQAVNKVAAFALSSQVEAEKLEVDIDTNFKKVSKGEIDGLLIKMNKLKMPPYLTVNNFQLKIGKVTVNPTTAIKGKIQLLHPSEGKLSLELDEDQLNQAFSQKFRHQRDYQIQSSFLENGTIVLRIKNQTQAPGFAEMSLSAIPKIDSDRKTIILETLPWAQNPQIPVELTQEVLAAFPEIINLNDWEKKGTTLSMDQLEITAGWLHLEAIAQIVEFPTN